MYALILFLLSIVIIYKSLKLFRLKNLIPNRFDEMAQEQYEIVHNMYIIACEHQGDDPVESPTLSEMMEKIHRAKGKHNN